MSSKKIPEHSAHEAFLEKLGELTEEMGFKGNLPNEPILTAKEEVTLSREQILWDLVMIGDVEGASLYIHLGANPNYIVNGKSLYDLAKANKRKEMIELLEMNGAKPAKTLIAKKTL